MRSKCVRAAEEARVRSEVEVGDLIYDNEKMRSHCSMIMIMRKWCGEVY